MSTRVYCVVTSPDDSSLFLVGDAVGWSLPHVECSHGWIPLAVSFIQADFRTRFGLDVVVLREFYRIHYTVACELECVRTTGHSSAGEWVDIRGPTEDRLPAAHREIVQRWREGTSAGRALEPWQQRGWFRQAVHWIERCLERKGLGPLGPIDQIKGAWRRSAVMRITTPNGIFFFKACPMRAACEPAALRLLSTRWSCHLPALVDADEGRRWMLTREAAGVTLDDGDAKTLANAARLFADLQIDQAAHVGTWLASGFEDRGLDVIERRLGRLLLDIPRYLKGAGLMSEAECGELFRFAATARELCRRLREFAVPVRSIHGEDFRSGNVIVGSDQALILIDWSEVVVSHPFFSAQRFLWFMSPPPRTPRHEIRSGKEDATRRGVRDAYIEPFGAFESRCRLLEAFRISSLLAPIYDALRFEAEVDLEEVFKRGLTLEEERNSRVFVHHLLGVCRAVARPPSLWDPARWL